MITRRRKCFSGYYHRYFLRDVIEILFLLEVFVLLDMLSFPYEDEFGMFAGITRWEWFALHACHFVCRGVSVMSYFVDTGYRDIIAGLEFLRHWEPHCMVD